MWPLLGRPLHRKVGALLSAACCALLALRGEFARADRFKNEDVTLLQAGVLSQERYNSSLTEVDDAKHVASHANHAKSKAQVLSQESYNSSLTEVDDANHVASHANHAKSKAPPSHEVHAASLHAPVHVHAAAADDQQQPIVDYQTFVLGSCMFVFCFVVVLTWLLGTQIALLVAMYIGSLVFVKFSMKKVFEYGFEYPKAVTAVHLLVSSAVGFGVLLYRCWAQRTPIKVPSSSEFWLGIFPIAMTFGLSIACENSALVMVSTAFSECVASTAPLWTCFLTWLAGIKFHSQLLLPVAIGMTGVAVSTTGEMNFSPTGCVLLVVSCFLRGSKVVLQQQLMSGTAANFEPMSLMAYCCGLASLQLIVYSAVTEGLSPYRDWVSSPYFYGLTIAIMASALLACCLNVSALFMIKLVGAVGTQIISQLKSLLVVLIGMFLLHETFTHQQQAGFIIMLCGIFWYTRLQKELDRLDAAETATADTKCDESASHHGELVVKMQNDASRPAADEQTTSAK